MKIGLILLLSICAILDIILAISYYYSGKILYSLIFISFLIILFILVGRKPKNE